jgi:hypothetical protein
LSSSTGWPLAVIGDGAIPELTLFGGHISASARRCTVLRHASVEVFEADVYSRIDRFRLSIVVAVAR